MKEFNDRTTSTLAGALEHFSKLQPDASALYLGDSVVSWKELQVLVNRVALNLLERGVKQGSRIVLIAENSLESVCCILASLQIGTCVVPLHMRLSEREWADQIDLCSPHLVVSDIAQPDLGSSIVMLASLFDENVSATTSPKVFDMSETACILFTSGSSGESKGVLLPISSLYYGALGSNQVTGFVSDNIWLLSLPLYHTGGFCILMRMLLSGAAVEIPGGASISSLKEVLPKSKSDFISLVPTQLYELLGESSLLTRLQSFKTILLGGAASSSALIELIKKHNLPVLSSYGMTETGALVSCTDHADPPEKLTTCGKALPYVELELDADGLLYVRGERVCNGYLGSEPLADRLLRTNDLGMFDEDGYLSILGRNDRIIISGGENISCKEIEFVAEQVPGVSLAAVYPVSDEKWGRRPMLVVESSASARLLCRQVSEHLSLNLPKYKHPVAISVVTSIPKNEYGKISYHQLEKMMD